MKYIEKIKKTDKKTLVTVVGLFLLYFVIQLQFLADPWFGTDELDIMMIGKRIAGGELLYKDICSQHMPFSYYISAIFVKLGARSVSEQRIAFYLFFSFFWTLLYVRYKNLAGKLTMMLYPVAFCCLIASYSLGTAILSEHIAGLGFVILWLEFMHYVKYRKVEIDNAIFISLSIVFTFGTVFVGAFAVAVIAFGVLGYEIRYAVQGKKSILQFFKTLIVKFWKLVLICAAPFAVLIIFYAATGSLHDFIKLAYLDNRTVYAKYMNGYGGSILNTVTGIVDSFENTFMSYLKPENFNVNTCIYLLAFSAVLMFIAKCFRDKEGLAGIIGGIYVIYCGARGFFDYHGTTFVAVAAFMSAYVFANCIYQNGKHWRAYSMPKQFATAVLVLIFTANYFNNFSYFASLHMEPEKDIDTVVLETLTEKDEPIIQGAFSLTQLMNADRISTCDAVTTPWTWESVGKKQLEQLEEDKPRVAMYSPDFGVWDYAQADYAPEFQKYMAENYTHLEGTVYVYVRNDYYEEASAKTAYLFQ